MTGPFAVGYSDDTAQGAPGEDTEMTTATATKTHPNAFDGLDINSMWAAVATAFESCTEQGMDMWDARRAVCDMLDTLGR